MSAEGRDAIEIVMEQLLMGPGEVYDLPEEGAASLEQTWAPRAAGPGATEDLERLICFAAFLGDACDSPLAAARLLGTLEPLAAASRRARDRLREATAVRAAAFSRWTQGDRKAGTTNDALPGARVSAGNFLASVGSRLR